MYQFAVAAPGSQQPPQPAQPAQYGTYTRHPQPQVPQYHSYQTTIPNNLQESYYQKQQHQASDALQYGQQAPSNPVPTPDSAQSCYNCGAYDHWAQNCPEPRRPVPFGALNNSRPFKRQKTGGPIITRYGPPPDRHLPGPRRGYTHPPVGQKTFTPQGGLPTPISADGQPPNYWHQQPQSVSPTLQYANHHWNPHQTSVPISQRGSNYWTTYGLPNPISSYGSQYASPASSFSNARKQSTFLSPALSQSLYAPPVHADSYTSPEQIRRYTSSNVDNLQAVQPQQHFVHPSQSPMPGSQSQPDKQFIEPWLEELQSLDFTEGKPSNGTIVWRPANPVAQPLPSTMVEADAVGRLPIAASLPSGASVSKYFRNMDENTFQQNDQKVNNLTALDGDPAFEEITLDCDAISVSELVERRNELTVMINDPDLDTDNDDYDNDAESYEGDEDYDQRQEISSADYKDGPESGPGDGSNRQSPVETEMERLGREQEERLAALGVSGFAKPVPPSMRGGVTAPELLVEEPRHEIPHSMCSSDSIGYDPRQTQLETPPTTLSPRGTNGRSRKTSISKESPHHDGYIAFSPESQAGAYGDSRKPQHTFENNHRRNPSYCNLPSPIPPKMRYFDGHADLHSPSAEHSDPGRITSRDSKSPGNGPQPIIHTKSYSPPLMNKSGSTLPRKRSYRHSSEESDGGPKRQEDETSHRSKKKQISVAPAYGRRW